jgi:hypothetical protein
MGKSFQPFLSSLQMPSDPSEGNAAKDKAKELQYKGIYPNTT